MVHDKLGLRVRKFRELKKVGLDELCERTGLSPDFLRSVVGVASRKYGEKVGAFIRLKSGAALKPEDVRDHCRGRISRYKIPRYVAFVDAFPMTASGKIQKYKLRQQARELWPEAMA